MPVAREKLAVVEKVRVALGGADVVYATRMINRATLGSTVARRPLVIKLTTDPAYERARRWGIFDGDMDAFQAVDGDVRIRSAATRTGCRGGAGVAGHLPSAYLRDMAVGWGSPRERTLVVPNPAPDCRRCRRGMRHAPRSTSTAPRSRSRGGSAVRSRSRSASTPSRGWRRRLLVAGDGPEREEMERLLWTRVRFLGPLPRDEVLRLFRAADASLLSSTWENFPHTVVSRSPSVRRDRDRGRRRARGREGRREQVARGVR